MRKPGRNRPRRVVACPAQPAATRRPGGHEAETLDALARRIARLMACDYAGVVDAPGCVGEDSYLVPETTLVGPQARRLCVHDAADLFGGVVPHRFVATKLVSHPAIGRPTRLPRGWAHALADRLADAVLPGFSVFGREDAFAAFDALAHLGPMRFKLARGIGGNGQRRIATRDDLDAALAALPKGELERHGASLEQDLRDTITYSIGVAECAGIRIAYHGRQRTTRGPHGHEAYAGSDLDVIRGDLDDLVDACATRATTVPRQVELLRALRQARRYDAEMRHAYPGFFASRRNYDVVAGHDAGGERRSGVLEQSWRIGGASPAELLALEAFAGDPTLQRVRTSSHEVYGDCTPPAGAVVHYAGHDPRLGPLRKYAVRLPDTEEPLGHPP